MKIASDKASEAAKLVKQNQITIDRRGEYKDPSFNFSNVFNAIKNNRESSNLNSPILTRPPNAIK